MSEKLKHLAISASFCYSGWLEMNNKEKQKLIELAQTAKKESRQIDFKERFNPESAQDWAEIIKDIIAMANSGGGIVLFGIKDNGSFSDFNQQIVLDIDPADISNKISAYTQEDFSEFEIEEITRKSKSSVALLVSGAETPIVFTRPGADIMGQRKPRPAFVRGSIYFRHGAKSEPGTTNDIRDAIDKILNRNKKTLFQGIRKIANIKEGDEVIVSRKETSKLFERKQRIPGKIVSDKNAQLFRPDNAHEIWPFRAKDLLIKLNKDVDTKRLLTNYDITCIKKQHNITAENRPEYIWRSYQDVSPRYSNQFINWLSVSHKKNPNFFNEAKEYCRKKSK